MNLPGDLVHHVAIGFARLVLPLGGGRWVVWARGIVDHEDGVRVIVSAGPCVVDSRFHNCRRGGA
jgi:hypothetical protein